jgi:hypothetical protein
VAVASPDSVDRDRLVQLASAHRREDDHDDDEVAAP